MEAKTTITQLPGSKVITVVHGDFKIVDIWFTTEHSDMSYGMTMIYHYSMLVWSMDYRGYYEKPVIPFLKECLGQAYLTENRFCGCRGPSVVRQAVPPQTLGLRYENRWRGNFRKFSGKESIFHPNGLSAGYHRYSGGSMLENYGSVEMP